MKLEPPLSNLVGRCQTLCIAECCGLDAYDFSPVQVASYLTMHKGAPDAYEIERIRAQLEALKAEFGTGGTGNRTTIEEMNQHFQPEDVDALVDEILFNLDVAVQLCAESAELRYKKP